MKTIFNSVVIALLLLLSACSYYEEIEFMEHTPLLVVNTVSDLDTPWRVQVSATRSLNDTRPYQLLNNVKVDLYQDGEFKETLTRQDKGIYTSVSTQPAEGKTYLLKVSAPGFAPCQASYFQPEAAVLGERKFVWLRDEYGYSFLEGKVQLQDPDHQEDIYYIRMHVLDSVYDGRAGRKVEVKRPMSVELPQHPREYGMDGELFFRDATFNGQVHELRFRFYPVRGRMHFLEIGRTTAAYYKYARTYEYNGAETVLSMPRQVYNNVSGGVGIAAGRSANVLTFTVR